MKNFINILLVLLFSSAAFSQSLEIVSVDPSNYPEITAEVKVKDAAGKDQRNLRQDLYEINDGGKIRPVKFADCDNNTRKLSLIITIDRSGSMMSNKPELGGRNGKDLATAVATNFIRNFPYQNGEVAITTFSSGSNDGDQAGTSLLRDFSKDEVDLVFAVNNEISYRGDTDFNKGFLGYDYYQTRMEGALDVAERAKYKPFILFITDGIHKVGPLETAAITTRAQNLGAIIYPISLGLPLPVELESIATATGGSVGDNFTTEQQFETFYQLLLLDATTIADPAPCIVRWDTDCEGGDLNIQYNDFGNPNKDTIYTIDPALKPFIEFSIPDLSLLNQGHNAPFTTRATITARNNFVDLNGFESTDPRFSIVGGLTGRLNRDQTRDIDIEINTPVREYISSNISIEGSNCSGDINVEAGFIFAEDINVGSTNIGVGLNYTATATFCNYSDEPLNVQDIFLGGANVGEYTLNSPTSLVIQPGDCIDLDFSFLPTAQGSRTATYRVVTDRGEYTANITGAAGGAAEIAADPFSINPVNCQNSSSQFQVDISNTGQIDLNVSDIQITGSNAADFTLVTGNTFAVIPSTSNTVTFRFAPQNVENGGLRTAIATVINDSQNDQSFEIQLEGNIDPLGLVVDKNNIDLGVLCPNEFGQDVVLVSKSSAIDPDFDYSFSNNNTWFTVQASNSSLTGNNSDDLSISIQTADESLYEGGITVIDACGVETRIDVRAVVSQPEIVLVSGDNLTSNIGQPTSSVIEFRNTSEHVLTITGGSISDPQVKILTDLTMGNIIVNPGATFQIDVEYLPTGNNQITPDITLTTNKCNYSFVDQLIAAPGLLTAKLIAPDPDSGMEGETITIEFEFTDKEIGFNTLNTDKISFDLYFYKNFLKYIPKNGITVNETVDGQGDIILEVVDYPIQNLATDIISLDFTVLGGDLPNTTITELTLTNVRADGYVIDVENGRFLIRSAEAFLDLPERTLVNTGDIYNFPVFVIDRNEANIRAFHEGLSGSVVYNPLVLKLQNDIPVTYSADFNSASFELASLLNILPKKGESVQEVSYQLGEVQFRVLYGNERESEIRVEGVKTDVGNVVIRDSSTIIEVEDLCEYRTGGQFRLLTYSEADLSTGLNIENTKSENGHLIIDFNTIENSDHHLQVMDVSGRVVHSSSGYSVAGRYSIEVDALLQSGTYFIQIVAPSEQISKPIMLTN
ncbi:MAG: hypothetical protein Kapaf2KO_14200 [Candidatus Kapaibacteriales bacterium]